MNNHDVALSKIIILRGKMEDLDSLLLHNKEARYFQ